MKAIETVMQLEEMHGTIKGIDVMSCSHQEVLNLKAVAYAQAEITFKARQDEIDLLQTIINSKDVAITDLKSLLELAKEYAGRERRAGIREAVSKLEGWRKLGAHLISDEAIQELRNLGG